MNRLTGKKVLVTGASTGFGRAIALACAEQGADVALVARSEGKLRELAALIMALGRRALVCVADLADESQISAAVARVQGELGEIDVLVNNAGTNAPQRSIQETSSEQWRELLEVNLTSAFLFSKAFLPGMIARRQGTIINIGSRASFQPSLFGGVAYSAAKMGMDGLTQVTNEEGNRYNVRACLICPGEGDTPLLEKRPAPPPPERRQRMLQPEDIAAVVVLVASMPPHVNINLLSIVPTNLG